MMPRSTRQISLRQAAAGCLWRLATPQLLQLLQLRCPGAGGIDGHQNCRQRKFETGGEGKGHAFADREKWENFKPIDLWLTYGPKHSGFPSAWRKTYFCRMGDKCTCPWITLQQWQVAYHLLADRASKQSSFSNLLRKAIFVLPPAVTSCLVLRNISKCVQAWIGLKGTANSQVLQIICPAIRSTGKGFWTWLARLWNLLGLGNCRIRVQLMRCACLTRRRNRWTFQMKRVDSETDALDRSCMALQCFAVMQEVLNVTRNFDQDIVFCVSVDVVLRRGEIKEVPGFQTLERPWHCKSI